MDGAINAALAMAPAATAASFDTMTRAANDRLVQLEREAFGRIAAKDLAGARAILESPTYLENKAVLARGTQEFTQGLQVAVNLEMAAVERRSWRIAGLLLVAAVAGFVGLWRLLNRHLSRAQALFSAKQQEITKLALRDTLTGLANRRSLLLQLRGTVARAERSGQGFAVMVIDLDGFKPINDKLGHAAGDAVLAEVGRRLSERTRDADITARLGGDEFVLVLSSDPMMQTPGFQTDVQQGGMVHQVADRLMAVLSERVMLPQGDASIGASIGIAFFPNDAQTADDLIRKADLALYTAKHEGKGRVRFFQRAMEEALNENALLRGELAQAISRSEIVPFFQPQVDLHTGALVGFEVLARWIHPRLGIVSPATFIPLAESSGLIGDLTLHLTRAALRAACNWPGDFSIAVNVAPCQLKRSRLANDFLAVLAETHFPPERFEIEVTEDALRGDLEVVRGTVLALKEHGVRVALDDFGVGYSSLSRLSELPFDVLKIDRSFVHHMQTHPESTFLIRAIISLGQSLNLPTLAEGIESAEQARKLRRMGCQLGQGYFYAHPLPQEEVLKFIEQFSNPKQLPAERIANAV
jgi:diguanylate cyclase (GGDEF)-like protein